jgi:hypothetical protein
VTSIRPPTRIAWFADLEALDADLSILERLRDEIGLTTVVPESHLSHTSGFAASAEVVATGPLEDWRERPGLADHRTAFGVAEPAMAVLPGVVGGVDDGPLLRLTEACRRLGLEIWGHAGVWCYGAEVFPEFETVDLFGRSVLPASLPWGTMFCPTREPLAGWIAASLADAAARYDIDGWFLDHARYPSPGFGPGLLTCACPDCAAAASAKGVDLAACRDDALALLDDLRAADPEALVALATAGPAAVAAWFGRRPGILRWLEVRAGLLADRFAALGEAIQAASPRRVEFGSDVFPPGASLLGGHVYAEWGRTATYLTGGFGPKIGWGSVGRVTATSLGEELGRLVPGLGGCGAAIVAALVGADPAVDPADDVSALIGEIRRMGAARGSLPVYPPVAGPPTPDVLARIGEAIVDAGLHGAMLAGLESASPAQLAAIRRGLTEPLA